MTELWLNFKDESGHDRRESVGKSPYSIGRQPGNDLTIADSRLSRTHLKIDRFGEVFVVSDCGSSNGSELNGSPLTEPESLKNGDRLVLGGGFVISVEMIAEQVEARRPRRTAAPQTTVGADSSSIPTVVFIVGPLLVLFVLICGGGGVYFFGTSGPDISQVSETPFPTPIIDSETPEKSPDLSPSVSPTASATADPDSSVTPAVTPVNDEDRRIEENSAKFLRKIALSDPNAFLATAQVQIVKGKLSPLRGSSALGANLKAVKANASQFESMASSQGLKAQFLAAAALTKIGNRTGDPVATAKSMLPYLGDLRISLGNSLSDDCLLIMADYLRRERKGSGGGGGPSLQSILEGIPRSKIGGADPREIRTIWFLRKNNKISEESYQFALTFLAIGSIMQNPSDFGVNSEPVTF